MNSIFSSRDLQGFKEFVSDQGVEWRDEYERPLLRNAAGSGTLEMVQYLIEQGADIEGRDGKDGCTALHWASLFGRSSIIEYLLDKGADINAPDKKGDPPITYAMSTDRLETIELLLKRGAALDAKNKKGWTLIHHASARGLPNLIMWLLKKGLDPKALTNDGETAEQLASTNSWAGPGHPDHMKQKQQVWDALKGKWEPEPEFFKRFSHYSDKSHRELRDEYLKKVKPEQAVASFEGMPVMAVFDISAKGLELDGAFRDGLGDFLAMKVAETGKFKVVPRDQLKERLLDQKGDSYKECYDQTCQIELGRELAAEVTLATQISKLGSQCVVSSAIFDLKEATTSQAYTATGDCGEDDLFKLVTEVVGKVGE